MNIQNKELLNIQFFAGPGVGKSTISSGLFYNMKVQGYKVEFISEYAKGLTYSQDYTKLKDQLMVLANQYHKFYRTKNSEIDYLIHESPFLLGLVYFQEDDIIKEQLKKICREASYEIVNTDMNPEYREIKTQSLITFGINQYANVTISSNSEENVLIYWQKSIMRRNNDEITIRKFFHRPL